MNTDFETRTLKVLDILERRPPKPHEAPIVREPVTLTAPVSVERTPHVVYFVYAGQRIKIGISSRIRHRFSALRTSSPMPLSLLGVIYAPSAVGARAIERELHAGFDWLHAQGEWFIAASELHAFIDEHAQRWEP